MNAAAYLKGHGWRGEGFSLDQTDRGIAKPLLVQHRRDGAGLGTATSHGQVASQWWLNAFDKSLKEFGSSKSVGDSVYGVDRDQPEAEVVIAQSVSTISPMAKKSTSLYAGFVKAETLESTISKPQAEHAEHIARSVTGEALLETTLPLDGEKKSEKKRKRSRAETDGVAQTESPLKKKHKKPRKDAIEDSGVRSQHHGTNTGDATMAKIQSIDVDAGLTSKEKKNKKRWHSGDSLPGAPAEASRHTTMAEVEPLATIGANKAQEEADILQKSRKQPKREKMDSEALKIEAARGWEKAERHTSSRELRKLEKREALRKMSKGANDASDNPRETNAPAIAEDTPTKRKKPSSDQKRKERKARKEVLDGLIVKAIAEKYGAERAAAAEAVIADTRGKSVKYRKSAKRLNKVERKVAKEVRKQERKKLKYEQRKKAKAANAASSAGANVSFPRKVAEVKSSKGKSKPKDED